MGREASTGSHVIKVHAARCDGSCPCYLAGAQAHASQADTTNGQKRAAR